MKYWDHKKSKIYEINIRYIHYKDEQQWMQLWRQIKKDISSPNITKLGNLLSTKTNIISKNISFHQDIIKLCLHIIQKDTQNNYDINKKLLHYLFRQNDLKEYIKIFSLFKTQFKDANNTVFYNLLMNLYVKK